MSIVGRKYKSKKWAKQFAGKHSVHKVKGGYVIGKVKKKK